MGLYVRNKKRSSKANVIHKELNVFDAINSYATFFNNRAYAGYVKCGNLLIPNAHPAYVEPAEFERIQSLRRTLPFNRRAENGDPQHSKRHQSPFLLAGILYCSCGYAMSGQNYGGVQYYQDFRSGKLKSGNMGIPQFGLQIIAQ